MKTNRIILLLITISLIINPLRQLRAQGSDNCSGSSVLLTPTAGNPAIDYFDFTNSLTPSPSTPNPTGFYYTVSSDNQIFVSNVNCRDLWYRIQVPASGGFTVDLLNTGVGDEDLAIAIYDGCTGNVLAAADDYYGTDVFLEPSVTLSCLTPGSIVFARIWQYGCDDYNLPSEFAIIATDQNDLTNGDAPSSAEVLSNATGVTTTSSYINDDFTPLMYPDISTITCTDAGYAIAGGCEDRWYKISLPADKILHVGITNAISSNTGLPSNFTLQAFSGTPCSLTEIACGSGVTTPKINDIAFATATDVFIRIFDQDCDEYGTFNLVTTITPKNLNDLACNAQTLTVGGAALTDTIIYATPSSGLPTASCAGQGAYCRDIWYNVTAASSNTMKIKFNVTGNIGVVPNSIYVTAYSAPSCAGPFTVIACKSGTTSDSLQYYQNAGAVSFIRVMDFNCDTSAHEIFNIQALQIVVPPNDEACQAFSIEGTDTTIASLINATQSATLPNPTCNYNTANVCEDVWYKYSFTDYGTFDLKTTCLADCASNTTNIAVYTDSDADPCNGGFTQTGCFTSGGATTSITCIEGAPGDTYYFRLYDFDCNNNARQVTMFTKFTPATNSLPCYATTLDFGPKTDTVETCGKTSSPAGITNPAGCGFSSNANCEGVWYKATVPNNGSLGITVDPEPTNNGDALTIGLQAYTDSDNDPCNGGFNLLGACSSITTSATTINYSSLTPGTQIYFRFWDFNCNDQNDFTVSITSNNDVNLTAAVDGTTINLACGETITFADNGGTAAGYTTHSLRTVTFCTPDGRSLKIEEVGNTDIGVARTDASTCTDQNTGQNDELVIYDGSSSLSGNKIVTITGSSAERFGTFISHTGCVTFTFDASKSSDNGNGFRYTLSCVDSVSQTTTTVNKGSTLTFTDPGGALNNYPNNAFEIKTFCPSSEALSAGESVQAIMNNLELETLEDKLYVYDGNSVNSPLLGQFSGHTSGGANVNQMGLLRASATNASGCLTFLFVSDATINDVGFNAIITTGKPIGSNGGESCSQALDISGSGTYLANTFLATGDPRNTDPNLCIPDCLTQGITPQDITQFEGTLWYKFTTPTIGCTGGDLFNIDLTNFSTQLSAPPSGSYPSGTFGTQMALFKTNTCLANPADWPARQTCYDILQNGDVVTLSGLLPSTTYYMMFDNFAARPGLLDIIVTRNDVDSLSYAGLDGDTTICSSSHEKELH